MLSTEQRVVEAMRLQPMSVPELSRCLSIGITAARMAVYQLAAAGAVEARGVRKRVRQPGRPSQVFGLSGDQSA